MKTNTSTQTPILPRLATASLALLLAATACTTEVPTSPSLNPDGTPRIGNPGGATGNQVGLGQGAPSGVGALTQFVACEDFLAHVKAEATERVGPYGLNARWETDLLWSERDFEVAADSAELSAQEQGSSQTNNQVAGIDEPDLVKTDGKRIVAILDGSLHVIDVAAETPFLIGTLRLTPQTNTNALFLVDDRVVLLGNGWSEPNGGPTLGFGSDVPTLDRGGVYATPYATITAVDISGEPALERTLRIDGAHVSSRLIDGVARIVTVSSPTGLAWVYPEGGGLSSESASIEDNKQIIARSTINNWVPYYILTGPDGTVIDEGSAVPCHRAQYPERFAGFNMLTVLTVDLNTDIELSDATGVLADGETVYASVDSLYIATNDWRDSVFDGPGILEDSSTDGVHTQLHQFDISGPDTNYVATGSVEGYLLNQFSMSEHEGDLRVATTTSPSWRRFNDETAQESAVTVLRPSGGVLETIGSVGGLGKGERIYAVRFLGDVGYVVTFRQVDPLYTIDLHDPTTPTIRGELKIPGYSSYLHPLDDGLVIGVGQDATEEGRTTGTQMALFDVSDLNNPRRVAKINFGTGTTSEAEYDHHAFLQWSDRVFLPLREYNWTENEETVRSGAVVVKVAERSLHQVGYVRHPGADRPNTEWSASILRTMVIDGSLYTVSRSGVMKSDLNSLEELSFLGL